MAETKSALVTGVTGQDGSYLAELLLEKGYDVYGLVRCLSTPNYERIEHILDDIHVIEGDLTDQSSVNRAILESKPEEIYNLAAQSFVATSWNQPILTVDVSGAGVVRVLESVRHLAPEAKMYQASTSELYGKVIETPQKETTPFYPRSPYGFSKLLGYWATVNYRESFDLFASNGILFNHESPRRGLEFVTHKVTDCVARIHLGLADKLHIGNLDAKRDWGYAPDYVEAMWLMLQQENPDDFVIATGKNNSVRELVMAAFLEVGINNWEDYVVTDEKFMRPAEVKLLLGDASKAEKVLGWKPKVTFEEMISLMVKEDIKRWERKTR